MILFAKKVILENQDRVRLEAARGKSLRHSSAGTLGEKSVISSKRGNCKTLTIPLNLLVCFLES